MWMMACTPSIKRFEDVIEAEKARSFSRVRKSCLITSTCFE